MANDRHNKRKKNIFIIWSEFIPFWLLYRLFRLLPLKAAYAVSSVLFMIYYFVAPQRRNYAIKHLLHAGVAKNEPEAIGIARKVYMNFAMLMVEIVKMDQCVRPDNVRTAGSKSTIEETLQRGDKNQNVIIVTAHYGNWELAGTVWAHFSGIPMVSVMREFENPLIGKYILRHRCGTKELFKNNWHFLLVSRGHFRLCRFVTKLRLCSSPSTPKFIPDTLSIKYHLFFLQLLIIRLSVKTAASKAC
ncbi:MAG: lysophospholipid acyltransferase family protein [Victivallaceae bacterium]